MSGAAFLTKLRGLDAELVCAGFPAISPWWWEQVERFYLHPTAKTLVVCAGRRSGKSSTLCRVACGEALFGEHRVSLGDVGTIAFLSVDRTEASARIRTIKAILDAVGARYRPCDGGVELESKPVQLRVLTASISGVSGATCLMALGDEVSKWKDLDTGANPATDVLASLRPTMATMLAARLFLSSSPFGTDDAHARAFALGDTDYQCVAHAPTWIANPTVTEARCRELEQDGRIFAREYAAIPQTGILGAFDVDAVDRAFRDRDAPAYVGNAVMVIDASSGRKDAWTWGVCRWVRAEKGAPQYLRFDLVDAISGRFWQQTTGAEVVQRIADVAKSNGVVDVHGDQRESLMLSSEFPKCGLRYTVHDWSNPSKIKAVEFIRRAFADRAIQLPEHEKLRRELLSFEERITASGAMTFGARGSGHDDFVALLLTASMAHAAGDIPSAGSGEIYTPRNRGNSRWGSSARGF